jgi:Tol biopolymer transport system component
MGRIVFSAGGSLHVVDAASGADTIAPLPDMRQPDFRADGDLIIAKGFQGPKTSLWTIDAHTGSYVREQSDFSDDFHPFWSPDGGRFVYDSLHQGFGNHTLYTQRLDTKVDEILHYGGMAIIGISPVWMADDWIAFTGCDYWPGGSGGSNCGIYRMPSWSDRPFMLHAGSLTLRVTDTYGQRLLLMSEETGDWEVHLKPVGGNPARNLTNSPGSHDGLGTFSPDGALAAFVSNRGGAWAVWVVKLDGSGLSRLFDLPAPLTGLWTEESMSWGP